MFSKKQNMSRKVLINLSNNSASSNDFTTYFPRPLSFPANPDGYEVALQSATCYYVSPNITTGVNDTFRYFNGAQNRVLTLPQGLYNITELNNTIHLLMTGLGDNVANIIISPDFPTNKAYITVAGGYTVDFTGANTFRSLLGFNAIVVNVSQLGSTIANISNNWESIHIHCDLITNGDGSYTNNTSSDVIGTMLLDRAPGSQLSIQPSPLIWIPIDDEKIKRIDSIRVYFTTQAGIPLNFLGEPTTCSLYIRKTT